MDATHVVHEATSTLVSGSVTIRRYSTRSPERLSTLETESLPVSRAHLLDRVSVLVLHSDRFHIRNTRQ